MKAKKQKLEEQIINLYLKKQISGVLKRHMLLLIATEEKKEILALERLLNDQDEINKILRYMTLFEEKNEKVGCQYLQLHSEEHTRQLCESLTKKGFLKCWGVGEYSVIGDFSLDVNTLSDQEFLLLVEMQDFTKLSQRE